MNVKTARRDSARRSPTAGNRGQGGKWLHPPTRLRIYARDGWRCVWCTCEVERPTLPEDGILVAGGIIRQASIDHVVPRSRGGSNSPANLITACATCNAKRNDLGVTAFAAVIAETHGCGCGDCHTKSIDAIVRRVRAAQKRKLPSKEKRDAKAQATVEPHHCSHHLLHRLGTPRAARCARDGQRMAVADA